MENLFVSALLWTNIIQTDSSKVSRSSLQVPQHQTRVISNPNSKALKTFKKKLLYDRIKKQAQKNEKPTTLIFAPHPDDEILCCAMTIRDRIEKGESVKIIYVTNGDAKDQDYPEVSKQYGEVRIQEARSAAKSLGLKNSDLLFLDYPDGYLALLDDYNVTTSRFTGQYQTNKTAYQANKNYTWLNLRSAMKEIITNYKPKEIFVPNQYLDQHWDHREVGRVATFILEEMENPPKMSMYAIHRKKRLSKIDLNPFKLNLIDIFKSQFHTKQHKAFLENFAEYPEVFRTWEKK